MAEFAKTACQRCREHKLKCSRELPKCARCIRVGMVCTFPTPPDRKALAALRQPPKKRNTKTTTSEAPFGSLGQSDHLLLDDNNSQCGAAIPSSAEVQELLYSTYFRCMFNPTLLFHRPTFTSAFQAGHVPSHVLLAMYAIATIFLTPSSSTAKRTPGILRPLGYLKALGKRWAIVAGQQVLQSIDQPTLDAVRTCQILTLYWFSQGESQRNTMFSGIAYKAACTLGLNASGSIPSPGSTTSHSQFMHNPEWLEAEARRRCFWAVWFTQAINSDHRLQGMSLSEPILNLPLPIGDTAYDHGAEEPLITVSASEKGLEEHRRDAGAEPSIMAELMKVVLIWAKVRDHVEAAQRSSTSTRLTELFDLENQLSAWSCGLPSTLKYSKRNLYEHIVVHQRPVFILLHAMFSQCRMVLHSSLVPMFSGIKGSIPHQAINMSAQISVQMAQKISELGTDVLALEIDPTDIASFVGYCLYVSASVHMTFAASSDASLASSARTNMMSNLKLIKSMKVYLSNLEKLWFRLSVLYASQQSGLYAPRNEEPAAPTVSPAHLREIDQLAAESRDTGNLSEPLADSVLTFTLRKLRSNAQLDPESLEHSEKTIFLERLSQFTDGRIPVEQQQQWTSTTRDSTIQHFVGAPQNQSTVSMTAMPASYVAGHVPQNCTSVVPFSYPSESDWWQFNLNDYQEPIFSYDTLFSLGTHT